MSAHLKPAEGRTFFGGLYIEGVRLENESAQQWAGVALRRALIQLAFEVHGRNLTNDSKLEALHTITNPLLRTHDARPINDDGSIWMEASRRLKIAAERAVSTSLKVVYETAAHCFDDAAELTRNG